MQLRQLPPPQLPVVVYTAAASIDATIAVALVAGRLEGDELRDSAQRAIAAAARAERKAAGSRRGKAKFA